MRFDVRFVKVGDDGKVQSDFVVLAVEAETEKGAIMLAASRCLAEAPKALPGYQVTASVRR